MSLNHSYKYKTKQSKHLSLINMHTPFYTGWVLGSSVAVKQFFSMHTRELLAIFSHNNSLTCARPTHRHYILHAHMSLFSLVCPYARFDHLDWGSWIAY